MTSFVEGLAVYNRERENAIQAIDLRAVQHVRRLDQYFGIWAIEPERGHALFNRAREMNLVQHVQDNSPHEIKAEAEPLTIPSRLAGQRDQTLAVITIAGTLTKAGSSLDDSSSLVRARRDIQLAANDSTVDGILLFIDSPGGTAAGTQDVADAVREANAKKPVLAFVEDLAASAAYWIASQAEEIQANNPTATIGSIGVYSVVYDFSAAFEKEGVKAHLFTTGPFKGAGTIGTPLNADQAAIFQARVDEIHSHFKTDIAAGRKMGQAAIDSLATGRTWLARDAQSLGLIDRIGGLDSAAARLQELIDARALTTIKQEPPQMAAQQTETTPAATEQPTQTTTPAAPAVALFSGRPAADWIAAFGDVGGRWAIEGKTWEQALALRIEALEGQVSSLTHANANLQAIVETLKGASTPATFQPDGSKPANTKAPKAEPLAQFIRVRPAAPSNN